MSDPENPGPHEVAQMVESIYEWLSKQPHLPHIEDKKVVEKFLVNCKFRLQKTKEKLESYYSARTNFPSVFQDRDPCSPRIRASAVATPIFPLLRSAPNGRTLFFTTLNCHVDDFDPMDYMKRMFIVCDVTFCEATERLDYEAVVDYRGFTFRHFLKLTTVAPTFMAMAENVIPATMKGIHYVNAPPFIDKIVAFFKLSVKPKLRERFFVHKDLDALCEAIGDRDILPSDLGGNDVTIAELSDAYQKRIESYKSWFEKEEDIRSNEDLRPKSSIVSWLTGTEGSFKQLIVD